MTHHTDHNVYFSEQEFYVLSNFSAFRLRWQGHDFDTAEHAYHWNKFRGCTPRAELARQQISNAHSAHEAFHIAQQNAAWRHPRWNDLRVDVMRDILRAKVEQHEYVRRKLLETGNRELIENSWRDRFWRWGPDRNGYNMLGKLWMEIRADLRSIPEAP